MTLHALAVPVLAVVMLAMGTHGEDHAAVASTGSEAAAGPPVQAVLFFAPTCGHCHLVISEALPPLFALHGGAPTVSAGVAATPADTAFYRMSNGTLELLLVDVSATAGQVLFEAANARLDLDSAGVPRLDVGDRFLVGSREIPAVFPGIVEAGLADGGIPWPAIPGIDAALASFSSSERPARPTAAASAAPIGPTPAAGVLGPSGDETDDSVLLADDGASLLDRVGRDPVGNGLAIVVLVLLMLSIIIAPVLAIRRALPSARPLAVPILACAGFLVAVYLAAVETGHAAAVCGPVGDCAAVQASGYGQLLGAPPGLLGAIGYAAIGILWAATRVASGSLADAAFVLLGLATFAGALSSTYLTFLEPFVIGATCVWCLASALAMLVLLWLTAGPAIEAWRR